MDAMYPNQNLDGTPNPNWAEAPFNGKPASSFIMSLDGVAEESVSFDFFYQHYQSEVDANSGYTGAPQYIVNAASANPSAGVEEHWNNNTARQYSRNLDPVNGKGIELTYVNTNTVTSTVSPAAGISQSARFDIGAVSRTMAHIQLPGNGNYLLSIFTMNGSKIADIAKGNGIAGGNDVSLNYLHLSKGTYLLRLLSNGKQVEKQFQLVSK